jgi:hypothetical protein
LAGNKLPAAHENFVRIVTPANAFSAGVPDSYQKTFAPLASSRFNLVFYGITRQPIILRTNVQKPYDSMTEVNNPHGDGKAAQRIVKILAESIKLN